MERNKIYEKLNEIFYDVFDDESIELNDNTTSSDIDDWDSLTHISLISEIEDEFEIKFQMKEVLAFENVGFMVDAIQKKL